MKKLSLFITAISILFFNQLAFSQCVVATITYQPGLCSDQAHLINSVASVDCINPAYMTIQTDVDGVISSWNTFNFSEAVEISMLPNGDGSGPQNVCVTYTVYDIGDVELGSDEVCLNNFWQIITPIVVCQSSGFSNCGSYCLYMSLCGGTAPYVMDWGNGGVGTAGFYNCFEVAGNYNFNVVDANGCQTSIPIEITEVMLGDPGNGSCELASALVSGQTESISLCNVNPLLNECANASNLSTGWFHINSGTNTNMTIGTLVNYAQYWLTVYALPDGGDCSMLEMVYCSDPFTTSNCVNIEDYLTIQPNTEYYIELAAQNTSPTQNSQIVVVLGNEPATNVCGCTSPTSCNYNPDALINTITGCGYAGCNDNSACNFMQYATCNDGSCVYGANLNVQLFQDLNGDGIMQTGFFGEPVIGGTGYITIVETGTIVYPDANGDIVLAELPLGTYTINYTDPGGVWELSNGPTFTVTLPTCNGLNIGLTPVDNATMLQLSGPCCIWMMNIHCVNGFNPGMWVQNTGTVPLNGTFTMTFDGVLVPTTLSGAEPYDSYSDGVMVWNIVNQLPGTSVLYQCHINGPGAGFAGQQFDFTMDLLLVDGQGGTFYQNDWLLQPNVVCSYDPNDKYAVPAGYAEPHFILADDEIEYRIRFQNTGNAEAVNIVIEDTLDVAHLDLTTFYPVFASHNYSTVIDTDGHVQFIFNNINLPDSASDEPGSQGYVVYRIKPLPTLQGWDEIHNTAYIYFDGNEPVVTNTTTHTIYDCAWLNELPEYDNTCIGTYQTLDFTGDYIDSYVWTLDGTEQAGNTGTIPIEFDEAGEYTLGLTLSNPLCSVSSEMPIMVHANPDVTIVYDINTGIVTAPTGYFYAWYLFGELLPSENGNTLDPWQYTADAMQVYAVVTDTWGCTGTTNTVFESAVFENANISLSLFPNPMEDFATLKISNGNWKVELFNSLGQKVNEWNNIQNTLQITNENLSSGAYMVRVMNEQGISGEVMMVVR